MHICSTDAPADVAPTMLAVLRLPASWHQVLKTVRPVFRRSSTFALFVVLATGLVARTTRRTVVGMLAGAGMGAVVSFHSACRFFSQYAWDTDQLGLAVARLIVERLLDKDTSITVAIDDTLFRRWGPKVHHAFWTHDGSAQGPAKLGRGNRWVIVGIIVTLPFFSHPVCLPVLFRLWAGRAQTTINTEAIAGNAAGIAANGAKIDALTQRVDTNATKIDANRVAINAVGEKLAAFQDETRQRFDGLEKGQADLRTSVRSLEDNFAEMKDLLIRALDR